MENVSIDEDKMMSLLDKISNLIIINCLFVISSITIITAGSSLFALSKVSESMVRGNLIYPIKEYFHAFKDNLIKGIKYWIISLISLGCILFNMNTIIQMESNNFIKVTLLSVVGLVFVIYLLVNNLIFICPSRYSKKSMDILYFCIVKGFQNIGWSFLLITWNIANVLMFVLSITVFRFAILYYVTVGFSIMGLINAKCLNRFK